MKYRLTFLILFLIGVTGLKAQETKFVRDSTGKFIAFITYRGDTVLRDTLYNKKFTEQDVAKYLAMRPKFGDTTGRGKEIINILSGARFLSIFQCDAYSDALAMAEENNRIYNKVNRVLVIKSKRKLYLMKNADTVFTFNINLGPNPVGQKEREGDGRTPEGIYKLDWTRSFEPTFISYHINYPNAADIERAKKKGLLPGSDIMVHAGGAKPRTKKDWTNGCIALKNTDMVVFAKYVNLSDTIEIRK